MTETLFGRILSQKSMLLKKPQKIQNSDNTFPIKLTRIDELNKQQKQKQLANKNRSYRRSLQAKFINYHDDFNVFRKKVQLTNTNIDDKLNYLQQQISKLKISKIQKQSIQFNPSKTLQFPLSIPNNAKSDNQQNLLNASLGTTQQLKINSATLTDRNPQKQSNSYEIFIESLKDQISLDTDFTNILLSFPPQDREQITKYIIDNYGHIDANYFIISSVQQDPFQYQSIKSQHNQIQDIAFKLYKFYIKIQEHFNRKLLHCFSQDVILMLIKEINFNQITLGHLTSYINLKTSCQFRNRNLIKLIKRIGTNQLWSVNISKFVKTFTMI